MGNVACCTSQEDGNTVTLVTTSPGPTQPPPKHDLAPAAALQSEPRHVDTPPEKKPEPAQAVKEAAGLTLTFKKTDKVTELEFTFTHKPLGIDFYKITPVTVKRVHPDGRAQAMGVVAGWTLLKIQGEDIIGKSLEDVHDVLKRSAEALPR